ncbi:hypothetical protein ACNKUC_002440, partial [Staphylococcus pseudintermedius]
KPGIVGAFCRAYSIEEAIDTFIPELYDHHSSNRYTYHEGSTSGGLVLYENGKFAYSHHNTDPVSGLLVNSFDLIRIHLYGAQDEDVKADTPINRLPSYKAMQTKAQNDERVKKQLINDRISSAADDFDEINTGDDDSWDETLEITSKEKIYELIEDVCLSMKASDYLDMPERIDTVHSVNLSSKERKLYDELEKHYILESEEDGTIVAQSGASLSQKLLQLSNGAVYTDDESVRHLHDRKLDKLEEIIEESQGQPLLVFYNFKHDKERIMERFDEVVTLDDESYKDRWVEGKVKILLAHPASAGHGLNLQKGGHIIVWFGLTWSLELYQQANARLYRQGQTHTTIIHHIMTDNTIDQKVYQALQNKELTQEDLMQAIKARIKQYE